jgi:general secretion pathway protein D
VADERTNSLIVSAPEDIIPTVEKLVLELDVLYDDVTELRVFHLINADPSEVAEIFSQMFPDDTKSTEQNQGGFRFGGPFFGRGGGNQANQAAASSERKKMKSRVLAVPDPRTSSLIVSASGELMPQIVRIVEQLDASSNKKQKVYIYSLQNADVTQVEQAVRDMFERSTTMANRNNQNRSSALETRQQQNQSQNNSPSRTTGLGGGGGGGLGGSGLGQTFR